jgi:hypothetical protein
MFSLRQFYLTSIIIIFKCFLRCTDSSIVRSLLFDLKTKFPNLVSAFYISIRIDNLPRLLISSLPISLSQPIDRKVQRIRRSLANQLGHQRLNKRIDMVGDVVMYFLIDPFHRRIINYILAFHYRTCGYQCHGQ